MSWLLCLAIFIPVLLGLWSVVFFFFLELPCVSFVFFESALIVFSALFFYTFKRRVFSPSRTNITNKVNNKLSIFFYIVLGSALLTYIFLSLRHPNGGVDAWSIWNMRARFIYRLDGQWRNAFSLATTAHRDYPLLLPLSVVFGWKIVGHETSVVPAFVAAIFTFCTVALLSASVTVLRGKGQGFLAGLVLLSTPVFMRFGPEQCADIPLSFFFLATLVLFVLYESYPSVNGWLIILAGLTAGLSAWTKNEGLLFCIIAIIARSLAIIPNRGVSVAFHELVLFFCGLAAPLATIFFFKSYTAPPGDLFASQSPTSLIEKLGNASRYTLILKEYVLTGMKFTRGWVGAPLLLVYFLLMGKNREMTHRSGLRTGMYALSLMLVGYFFVYVITPIDLNIHLNTSLNRLFMQLWPSFVFFFFWKVKGLGTEASDDNRQFHFSSSAISLK